MNSTTYAGGNFILDRLSQHQLSALNQRLEVVELESGQVLYAGDAESDLRFVFFPIRAVASMLATLADGSTVEAGTAGNEGMVGAQSAIGSARLFERWIAQVPGSAARLRVADFRLLLNEHPTFRVTVQLYIQWFMALLAQSIACNTHHPLVERCARWLLLTHDRAGRDEFSLTQEFLATMLGVRRPGVSVAAATLANAGFISYVRGCIRVTDRRGLESATCECYRVTQREFERLFSEALNGTDVDLVPHERSHLMP